MVFSLKTLLYIGCGCFVGGALRYITSFYICSKWGVQPPGMPWNTLIINFVGCLFMGIFCALIHEANIGSPQWRAALTTGLCGGYSTLAAFAYENSLIFKSGAYLTGSVYIAATLVGSLAFYLVGYVATKSLIR